MAQNICKKKPSLKLNRRHLLSLMIKIKMSININIPSHSIVVLYKIMSKGLLYSLALWPLPPAEFTPSYGTYL